MFYRITNSTHIAKVPMKRLLSDTRTKMDLTVYLAEKAINAMRQQGRKFVVAWGSGCQATHKDVTHLPSSQEEADTMQIPALRLDPTAAGATEIRIHSPDTDVFILALRRYPDLCDNASFVKGTGQHPRVIKLGPIVKTFGEAKTASLPAFHAISGFDNTESFSGKLEACMLEDFPRRR